MVSWRHETFLRVLMPRVDKNQITIDKTLFFLVFPRGRHTAEFYINILMHNTVRLRIQFLFLSLLSCCSAQITLDSLILSIAYILNVLGFIIESKKQKRESQDDLENQKAQAVAALGGEFCFVLQLFCSCKTCLIGSLHFYWQR